MIARKIKRCEVDTTLLFLKCDAEAKQQGYVRFYPELERGFVLKDASNSYFFSSLDEIYGFLKGVRLIKRQLRAAAKAVESAKGEQHGDAEDG